MVNSSKLVDKQTKAKRIKILLKTYQKTFRSYNEMSNFKEPIMILIRNTRKTEFYDNVTTGWFTFKHSDGSGRRIKLSPEFLMTFDYGKRNFKGYICHEDYPTPLPESPVVTAEQFQWAIDKTHNDLESWKSKEITAKGTMWYKIGIGIAAIILALALAKLLVPDFSLFNWGKETIIQQIPAGTPEVPVVSSG